MPSDEGAFVPVADWGTSYRADPDIVWQGAVPPSNFDGKNFEDDAVLVKQKKDLEESRDFAILSPTQHSAVRHNPVAAEDKAAKDALKQVTKDAKDEALAKEADLHESVE